MTKQTAMRNESLYFYTPDFSLYDFGPDHPFSPLRQIMSHSLIKHSGLLSQGHISDIEPLDDETLQLIHTPEYIDIVRMAGEADGRFPSQAGIGPGDTPPFFNMHEAAAIRSAATFHATVAVCSGKAEHAVNLGGGLHHAFSDQAAGFCIYNDIAIAIEYARREHGMRVAYIDIDAHHGDGVQACFYDQPDVLTISFHETGRTLFPGTGDVNELGIERGYGRSINIPLEPGTSDRSWLECFESVVPELLRRFSPDLIISQHGVDAHKWDPLSHLELSCAAFEKATTMLHDLAHELCDGRWVALGGGGYDVWRVVPRAWTALWAIASHQPLPQDVPEAWLAQWQPKSPFPLPYTMHDMRLEEEAQEIYRMNRETIARLLDIVRPTF